MTTALLEAKNLKKYFLQRRTKKYLRAVDDVSFTITKGQTFGLVGESGCGKSTLGSTILRLYEPTSGQILFSDVDICALSRSELRKYRRNMQMVFQDSYSCFNPRMKIAEILAEPLVIHQVRSKAERKARVRELLDLVGLNQDSLGKYIHELSGGQRQRLGIARAIALHPKIIVADEPVSALDVSIQSQILNLMVDLKEKFGLSYLFISHDLAVVEHISDVVAVMYMGKLVEIASCDDFFKGPKHPYSKILLDSIPNISKKKDRKKIVIHGDVPNPLQLPRGCSFHPRCPLASKVCKESTPLIKKVVNTRKEHMVACHHL